MCLAPPLVREGEASVFGASAREREACVLDAAPRGGEREAFVPGASARGGKGSMRAWRLPSRGKGRHACLAPPLAGKREAFVLCTSPREG